MKKLIKILIVILMAFNIIVSQSSISKKNLYSSVQINAESNQVTENKNGTYQNIELDRKEEAIKVISRFLAEDQNGYSKKRLSDILINDKSFLQKDVHAAFEEMKPTWVNQASKQAKYYSAVSLYSKNEIRYNLMETDSFTKEQTQKAINSLETDWKENALKTAEKYLGDNNEGFSSKLLFETLVIINKFNHEEAKYAIKNVKIDNNKEAIKRVNFYLDNDNFGYSKIRLVEILTVNEYFLKESVNYAIENIKINWNNEALKKASFYLNNDNFGYTEKALKEALLSGDKFTKSEVEFALSKISFDWEEQVIKELTSILSDDNCGFSKTQVKNRLKQSYFTEEQITFAINKVNPNWVEEAVKSAKAYLFDYDRGYSKKDLLNSLVENDKYTSEEAKNAIAKINPNWNEQAMIRLDFLLGDGDSQFSKKALIDTLLEQYFFTKDEANYAISKSGIDWGSQALAILEKYLSDEFQGYSKESLLSELQEVHAFTLEESLNAIEVANVDWENQVLKAANCLLEYKDVIYSTKALKQELSWQGFNQTNIDFVISKLDYNVEEKNYPITTPETHKIVTVGDKFEVQFEYKVSEDNNNLKWHANSHDKIRMLGGFGTSGSSAQAMVAKQAGKVTISLVDKLGNVVDQKNIEIIEEDKSVSQEDLINAAKDANKILDKSWNILTHDQLIKKLIEKGYSKKVSTIASKKVNYIFDSTKNRLDKYENKFVEKIQKVGDEKNLYYLVDDIYDTNDLKWYISDNDIAKVIGAGSGHTGKGKIERAIGIEFKKPGKVSVTLVHKDNSVILEPRVFEIATEVNYEDATKAKVREHIQRNINDNSENKKLFLTRNNLQSYFVDDLGFELSIVKGMISENLIDWNHLAKSFAESMTKLNNLNPLSEISGKLMQEGFKNSEIDFALKNLEYDFENIFEIAIKSHLENGISLKNLKLYLKDEYKMPDNVSSSLIKSKNINWNKQALVKLDSLIYIVSSKNKAVKELKERGFLDSQVKYALDNTKIDWELQAELLVIELIDRNLYTRVEMLETLVSDFYLTKEEALKGIKDADLGWNEIALAYLNQKLSNKSNSKNLTEIILEKEGFLKNEIKFAINKANVDWDKQGSKFIKEKTGSWIYYSKSTLIEKMETELFTKEEITKALNETKYNAPEINLKEDYTEVDHKVMDSKGVKITFKVDVEDATNLKWYISSPSIGSLYEMPNTLANTKNLTEVSRMFYGEKNGNTTIALLDKDNKVLAKQTLEVVVKDIDKPTKPVVPSDPTEPSKPTVPSENPDKEETVKPNKPVENDKVEEDNKVETSENDKNNTPNTGVAISTGLYTSTITLAGYVLLKIRKNKNRK